jgi:hypothetical protein
MARRRGTEDGVGQRSEKMLAGEPYNPRDPELIARYHLARQLLRQFAEADSTDPTMVVPRRSPDFWVGSGATSGLSHPSSATTARIF